MKIYRLRTLIAHIPEPNRSLCFQIVGEHAARFLEAQGSSHNHQAWPGGYVDHVCDVMKTAMMIYDKMCEFRPMPFELHEALLVLFLHDIEKPWKRELQFSNKSARKLFRDQIIQNYGIELTEAQRNALMYVEGEGDDYSSERRTMNELAAFCHMCDVASARIWHSNRENDLSTIVSKL